jgi:hypothetical protein
MNFVRVVKDFQISEIITEDGVMKLSIFLDLATHPVFRKRNPPLPTEGMAGVMSRALGSAAKATEGASTKRQAVRAAYHERNKKQYLEFDLHLCKIRKR